MDLASIFLAESLNATQFENYNSLISFLAIGLSGAGGCVIGGIWAERIGKIQFAIIALSFSSLSAVLIGFTFEKSGWVTIIIALAWGGSIIADSGQFSALAAGYSEKAYVGSALTFQMAGGFLITVVSIYLVSYLQPYVGWGWIFAFLSIGPILGVAAMGILLRLEKMATNDAKIL
ncbi:hypothetical protein [Marinococcus halophilus]|uniref:hypothetical protein n=1 Tax=Marinococcus halophilus TaxID=1371 RepID=UPI0009A6B288|nr:hypothetical protein [Marinococcus halophilus]